MKCFTAVCVAHSVESEILETAGLRPRTHLAVQYKTGAHAFGELGVLSPMQSRIRDRVGDQAVSFNFRPEARRVGH